MTRSAGERDLDQWGQIIRIEQLPSGGRLSGASHLRFVIMVLALLAGLTLIAYLQRFTPLSLAAEASPSPSAFIVIDGDTIRSPAASDIG
jgi:hypothetical protein